MPDTSGNIIDFSAQLSKHKDNSVAIKVPRLLAMPTNLIELSNCCISLEKIFNFSSVDGDDNGIPIYYKFSFL